MKLSARDKNLLTILVGVLVLVAVYSLVYVRFTDMTESIENETLAINRTISSLEKLVDESEHYATDVKNYTEDSENIMSSYPADIMTSDIILYVNSLGAKHDLTVTGITMRDVTGLETRYPTYDRLTPEGETITATDANYDGIYLYEHGLEVNFECGYEDLKDALEDVIGDKWQKSIHSLSLSYNKGAGNLTGNLTAGMYSMTGTGAVYERPIINGVVEGTDNIFKTFESGTQNTTEDSEELEEESSTD